MEESQKPRFRRRTLIAALGAATALAPASRGTAGGGHEMPVQPDGGIQPLGLFDLPRIEWEGGSAYWASFPRAAAAGWTNPAFFPMAVFFGRPAHAQQLKSVGINIFQAVEHNDPLDVATSQGIFCIVQDEFSQHEIGDDPGVVGLFSFDECDMGLGCGGDNPTTNLANMREKVDELRSRNDGRFVNANYSKGVLGTWWTRGTMNGFMDVVDVASADNYAYTSPDSGEAISVSPSWQKGAPVARAATYGWLVDRMRSYQSRVGAKPNWMFVETAMPLLKEAGARTISPAQIEGACWSAIIHEARGICFFQHNNDGINGGYSLVDCSEERKEAIRNSNTKIRALAPVINTQSYVWSFGAGLDTMLKEKDGYAYIFAEISIGTEPGRRTFKLPPFLTSGTVDVVDERGRTIAFSGGAFSDKFSYEYTHHIYRIAV